MTHRVAGCPVAGKCRWCACQCQSRYGSYWH